VLLRTSFRELLAHPLRTGLAVAGVAVAMAMLLDMLMLGSGIQQSFNALLGIRGYELRITPRGTLPFDTGATLGDAGRIRESVATAGDVGGVAPVLAANLLLGRAGGRPGDVGIPPERAEGRGRPPTGPVATRTGARVFVLGVDPAEQGIYRIVEGRDPEAPDEVVVEDRLAGDRSLAVGDTIGLERPSALGGPGARPRDLRIVGTAEFLYASREERPVAIPLATLQELTGREDRVSFFMVRLPPGVDADSAATRLSERHPALEVASIGELVERAESRLSYFRQLAYVLGTVSLVVTALLVGTVMAVSVGDRFGVIAALRAIGISRRSVLVSLAAESLLLRAVAGLSGLGLGVLTARWLERILADFPGLPRAVRFFVLEPRHLVIGYGSLLVTGTVAALLPAWRATTLEIAPTLHREEP